ncbi:MAG TPA: PAC2 family protein [Candidatus Dormibacteraeota bacterium]|nr:PAC2 family protein [Candidatus Dormibacteraeota bacterium]
MALYRLHDHPELVAPTIVAALDGWVDAGGAASSAVAALAADAQLVATFDPDQLFDYRSRRPTLEIVDGRLAELTWPELTLRHARIDDRDLLVLSGHEPDDRWRSLSEALVELAAGFEVAEWISLGAIPAAVPHTRPVPVLGTATRPDLVRGGVEVGPSGVLRVPAAALSVLEMAVSAAGIPSVGYFAQVPHYVSGPYPAAAAELLRALGRHLDAEPPLGTLPEDARQLRLRLDAATALDETSRAYVERLEAMVDESRLPSGDDLISDIERFLRDRGSSEGSQRS